jgi:hypothetical protein
MKKKKNSWKNNKINRKKLKIIRETMIARVKNKKRKMKIKNKLSLIKYF